MAGKIRECAVLLFVFLDTSLGDVTNTASLTCNFDADCLWRNLPNQTVAWNTGLRVVSDAWHSVPRGVLGSTDAFAFVRGDLSFARRSAVLASDLIPCQARPANFGPSNRPLGKASEHCRFFLWQGGGSLEVCVMLRRTRRALHCLKAIASARLTRPSWRPHVVTIPPIREPFRIALRANVSTSQQVVGLDKVVYEDVEVCAADAQRSALPPSHPKALARDKDLPSILRYAMPTKDSQGSKTRLGNKDKPRFQVSRDAYQLTSRRRGALRRGPQKKPRSPAAEDFLARYRAKLATKVARRERERKERARRRRLELRRRAEGQAAAEDGDSTAAPDGVCLGSGCVGSTTAASLTVFNGSAAGGGGGCSAADCGFETASGEECGWRAVSLPFSSAALKTHCAAAQHGDVRLEAAEGQCFLLAALGGAEERGLQVLSAPPLFTLEATQLQLWYYLPLDGSASLSLCLDGLKECVWRRDGPRRRMERWWRQTIQLRPGKLQLSLIVELSGARAIAAVDHLRLSSVAPPHKTPKCQLYQ